MSLTVHQLTRTGDTPASSPSLVEAGWTAVRHTFSRGWLTVTASPEPETFALGQNLYTYAFSPPHPHIKRNLNVQASLLLKEWNQDLHEDDVYSLADLADFQSGLSILSDVAPASPSDNICGLPLKYVPEEPRTLSRKPTTLPTAKLGDSMDPLDVSNPAPIPPIALPDPSFVLGTQSPSAPIIEVPHGTPHIDSTAHHDLADQDISMGAVDEEEDALALLEQSEGLHLTGPASPHFVQDEDRNSVLVHDLILPGSRATVAGAAEITCSADKESTGKGAAGTNAETASVNKGIDTIDDVQDASISPASPPRLFPSALSSPRAASEGPTTTPLFVTLEHLSGPQIARGGFYPDEREEEDHIVEEEDELYDDDDDEDEDDVMEVQLDVLESAQWEDFSGQEDIIDAGMDVEREGSQGEDELDELQDEEFGDRDVQGELERDGDRIEEDGDVLAEEYDDGIVAASQASAYVDIRNAAVAVHIDSSERDELEDHDSIVQDDEPDGSLHSLAVPAPEVGGESDVLSYITKPPSRQEELDRTPNASQDNVNEEQSDLKFYAGPAAPISEPAVHAPGITVDEEGQTPFTSLLDLLPRPHFHPVPLPPSPPFTLADLEPEDLVPGSPEIGIDQTPPAIPSLTSMFSYPSHLPGAPPLMPIAISPHTSSSTLAHLQRPYARAAWIVPVRGALPWVGASSAVLVPDLLHIRDGETSPTTTTILWTFASVRALWETLLSLREKGTCGPLGLSFHAARRPKPSASNASRPVNTNPDPRTALAKLDHIKIHVDTTHAAELRRALGEWAYATETTSGQTESSEWDFDEGAPIYVASEEEENSVNGLGLHLDLEADKGNEIVDAGAAGAEVDTTEPTEAKERERNTRPLNGAVLVLVDERNLGILIC